MKAWLKFAAVGLVLVIAALAFIPFLVNANTFRPTLEARMSAALGRTVKLGNLYFSPFSGSLVANDLSIADDPAFSNAPFLSARQLRIGVEMKPLILHRQIHIRSFEVEAPQIHLIQGPNGTWNFSSLSRSAAALTNHSGDAAALFRSKVDLVKIRDGRAVFATLPAQGPPRVYDHLRLTVREFSLVRQFPFEMGATVPGDGVVQAKGNVGPINRQNAARTAFDAQISLDHLNPVRAGFLDPAAGVAMVADIAAHAISDGSTVSSSGTVHMRGLQLVKSGAPSPEPIDLTYEIRHQLDDNAGQLRQATIHLGVGVIRIGGNYRLIPENPWVDLKVATENFPIDELQPLMMAAGVQLPNGSQLKGGTLTIDLAATGPANALVITGPLELDNTQMVGFDLGSKLVGIAALSGVKTGSTTSIQSLKLNFQASNAGIKVDAIDSVIGGMGESTGSGTISPTGAISFRLIAHVKNAKGIGRVGVSFLTKINQIGRSDAEKDSTEGVPMLVSGTANNPVITADVTGEMHRATSTLLGRAKHLFGKKGDGSSDQE